MLTLDKGKENVEVKSEDNVAKSNINDNFGLRLDQYAKKNAYMKVCCVIRSPIKFYSLFGFIS